MRDPSDETTQRVIKDVRWLHSRIKVVNGKWSYRPDFWTRATFVTLAMTLANAKILNAHDPEEIHEIVHSAVCALAVDGKTSPKWEDVRRAVQSAEANLRRGRPLSFSIVIPLNIKADWLKRKRHITFHGEKCMVYSWERVQRFPGWSVFQEAHLRVPTRDEPSSRDLRELRRVFTPLIMRARGTNVGRAFRGKEEAITALRAVFNFTSLKGVWSEQLGKPQVLSRVLPPPVLPVFREDGGFENYFFESDQPDYRPVYWSQSGWEKARTFFHRLEGSGFAKHDIGRLLVCYQEALDTTRWELGFLSMWRGLEEVARKAGRPEDLPRIVARLVAGRSELEDLLKALREHRNNWVHTGAFPRYGLREFNLLKIVTECVIEALLSLPRWIHDWGSLSEWIGARSLDDKRLKTRLRALRAAMRDRSRRIPL